MCQGCNNARFMHDTLAKEEWYDETTEKMEKFK